MKNTRPQFIVGNAIDVLRDLDDDSIDLVCTSPPYWGLRDYGSETDAIWGGDGECEHAFGEDIDPARYRSNENRYTEYSVSKPVERRDLWPKSNICHRCQAWKGQLGLEPTWQLYVEHLVEISKEVKRILKPTGSYYLVLGDTYLEKDKLMIPYEVARALRFELGFTRRNDITWRKPNAMPSSVKDRLTCTTERIFHFVKNAKGYFYDLDAIREPHTGKDSQKAWWSRKKEKATGPMDRGGSSQWERDGEMWIRNPAGKNPGDAVELTKHDIAVNRVGNFAYADPLHEKEYHPSGKNPGDYWSINTQPFPQAHFAVFPESLIEPIIKSSCPLEVCSECGKARERIVNRKSVATRPALHTKYGDKNDDPRGPVARERRVAEIETIGFTKCDCNADFEPGIVLDPFCGSGTTNLVAMNLGRASIGIDINADYIKMAEKCCRVDTPSLQDFGVGDE